MTANETNGSLISIVDDEECVRESLSSLLRSMGYAVREYASAEDFLTWGWWDETACLILDVRLPGMGGLELQRYLAEKQRERPIILISGHATENEQTWAMTKGAVAFLRKPFSDESLLNALRESIARGRAGLYPPSQRPGKPACPLCHDAARTAEIPDRFVCEHHDLHSSTMEMIKALNPDWVEQDGLCHRCWRFYMGVGRVVSFLRSPDAAPNKEKDESNLTPGARTEE